VGRLLAPLGDSVAFTPLGVLVALIFIGLPFVVRRRSGARGPDPEYLKKRLPAWAPAAGRRPPVVFPSVRRLC